MGPACYLRVSFAIRSKQRDELVPQRAPSRALGQPFVQLPCWVASKLPIMNCSYLCLTGIRKDARFKAPPARIWKEEIERFPSVYWSCAGSFAFKNLECWKLGDLKKAVNGQSHP